MPKAAKRKLKTPVTKVKAATPKPGPKRKPKEKRTMIDLPKSDKKSGPGATPGTPEKDPKNLPETSAIPKDPNEDPNEDKNTPPPHKQPHTPNTIHNRDQDPDHPANKTLSRKGDPSPRPEAEGITVAPEELLSAQEKEAAGGGDARAGVGPTSRSRTTTGPAKTIEDEGIGPRTPYPTGNPPKATESTTLSQGIHRGDEDSDQEGPNAPNARTGPTGPGLDERGEPYKTDPRPQERIGGPQEVATPPKDPTR